MRLFRYHLVMLSLIIVAAFSCNGNEASKIKQNEMLDQLSRIEGKFEWISNLEKYVFSNKAGIEKIIEKRNDEKTLSLLAENIDNLGLSDVTINERRLFVGMVFYEALTQLIYYEPQGADGDIAGDWAGYIKPDATPKQMADAKRAWLNVIKNREYTTRF